MRRSSRVNPYFFSGPGYEGPFTLSIGEKEDDESGIEYLICSPGRFSVGMSTYTTNELFLDPNDPDIENKNDGIVSLTVWNESGPQHRLEIIREDQFDQTPGIYTDSEGEEFSAATYRHALGYAEYTETLVEVEGEDSTVSYSLSIREQWWMGGDIQIPRIGRFIPPDPEV